MKVTKYNSTIGLNAMVPGYSTRKLVKIAFDKMEDGRYRVQVESARSLSSMKKLGTKWLTPEQLSDLSDSTNNVQEFRNFAALFGIEA